MNRGSMGVEGLIRRIDMDKELKRLLVELIEALVESDTEEHFDFLDHAHGTFSPVDRNILKGLSEKISNL